MARRLRYIIALVVIVGPILAWVYDGFSVKQAAAAPTVTASVETEPVPHSGDAADDSAIWVHPTDPALSTIIGTDKLGGIAVYDLGGRQLQYLPDGNLNNVDLRYNFPLGGQAVALVAAGNRSNNSIALYRVNPTTRLLQSAAAGTITTVEAYGACMYHSRATGKFYYFVNSKDGVLEQYELRDTGNGTVGATRVRSFDVGTQTEGCVADDELGHFYIGEELVGIWKYGAEPNAGATRTQVDVTGSAGNLTADVEGLAIYYASGGRGYLIASSQGSDDYAVYDRAGNNPYITRFAITASNTIDGVTDTDGIDVSNVALGSAFPDGLFVAQDFSNDGLNQNFKLVSWSAIARTASPALLIDTSWDPRGGGGSAPPPTSPTVTPTTPPTSGDPVLVGAGDIGECGVAGAKLTGELLDQIPGTVFTVGDHAYTSGTTTEFQQCYEPYWGRHKTRTYPAPGNHDYATANAGPYFDYFGSNAGAARQGYYSYNLGAWHVISLNSNIAADAASAQLEWLRADLAAHPKSCTVAYWHHPLFSSGRYGYNPKMLDVWRSLYAAGVDVVINGHEHSYERFAPQDPDGKLNTTYGIRQFVVGNGGAHLRSITSASANSEVRHGDTWGLLKLQLHASSYDWEFVPVAGGTFTDRGSAACVTSPAPTPTPGPTVTPSPTSSSTAVPPSGSTRIKDATFEDGSLTHGVTGVDALVEPVGVESSTPVKGRYSAAVAASTTGQLQENFAETSDLFVSFYLRPKALPATNARVALISDAANTSLGNLYLRTDGTLELRNGSTAIATAPVKLTANTTYRIGLHQKKGSGADGVLEAFLATGDNAFGAPFARTTSGAFTTGATRFKVGATNANAVNLVIDDLRVDAAAMPGPSVAEGSAPATPTFTPVPATATASPTPGTTTTPTMTPTTVPSTSTATAVPTLSADLLQNSGFELDANNDNLPDAWSSNSRVTRSNAVVHSGSYAMRHATTKNTNYTVSQVVPNITAGRRYAFSHWVNVPPTNDSFTFKLDVQWLNSSGNTISTVTTGAYSRATNGWQSSAADVVAPTGAVRASVNMVASSWNGTLYVDDLSLKAYAP